jgi:hypothetical protein
LCDVKDPTLSISSQMAVSWSALSAGRRSTPQKHYFSASGTHLCWRLSKPQSLVRPEGVGKVIKIIHLIGSRTRDLSICNEVPYYHTNTCLLIKYAFYFISNINRFSPDTFAYKDVSPYFRVLKKNCEEFSLVIRMIVVKIRRIIGDTR